jgi:type IV pilus biogenesis protein CpaD/CtpE
MRRVLAICVPLLLAGCGSSNNAATPAPAAMTAKPAVIITFDGERHICVVALSSEAQGSIIPCADVVPFVRDELRVASGSIYDTRTIAKFDAAEMAKTTQSLNDAGYRFNGGH